VIGRGTELDSITTFLDTARFGTAALVIRGEPGIGKTTLWHAAIARAETEDFTVLSCRPSSNETDLPYAGLGDLFAHVNDDATTALPAPQRNALDVALLRADAGESPLQRRAVSAAALHVLLDLAERAPGSSRLTICNGLMRHRYRCFGLPCAEYRPLRSACSWRAGPAYLKMIGSRSAKRCPTSSVWSWVPSN
jgi:hypothetical protein